MLNHLLDYAITNFPENIAILFHERTMTYSELGKKVRQLAYWLQQKGIHQGDRVLFFFDDSPEKIICYFACFYIGAIAVPTNSGVRGNDLMHVLNVAKPNLIITNHKLRFFLQTYRANHFSINDVISELGCEAQEVYLSNDTIATIFFSSGSTNKPKGITHNFSAHLVCANAMKTAQKITSEDRILAYPLDFNRSFGSQVLPGLAAGATIVLIEQFDSKNILDLIINQGMTVCVAPPGSWRKLINLAALEKNISHQLRVVTSGGDMVTNDLISAVKKTFNLALHSTIGMTELFTYAIQPIEGKKKFNAIGLPLPGVKLKIVDENSKDVPHRQLGEICIKSPAVMQGYWDDENKTSDILRDGWIHSGDLGYLDEEGYLFFQGRKKHIIVINGRNIAPPEVESILNDYDGIEQSAICGIPNGEDSQFVVAMIVLDNSKSSFEQQKLSTYVSAKLTDFKVPKYYFIVDDIPRNRRGKTDRDAVQAMALQSLNNLSLVS